tara:strand:- start:372 stop:827 length:456 start_codon:yes stop_codon:yes gene_type:complete
MYQDKLKKHNLENLYNYANDLTLKSLAIYASNEIINYNCARNIFKYSVDALKIFIGIFNKLLDLETAEKIFETCDYIKFFSDYAKFNDFEKINSKLNDAEVKIINKISKKFIEDDIKKFYYTNLVYKNINYNLLNTFKTISTRSNYTKCII